MSQPGRAPLPKQGDIWWISFPARLDGHEQSGRRPAVIMQAPANQLPTILVIPLTTQLDALRFPGTLLIEPDSINGLPRRSVALVFQLGAVDRRRLDHPTGNLPPDKQHELLHILDGLLGRP